MPVLATPRSFFESERDNVYASWREAFWRELLSNALDAGANRVMLGTRFDKAGDLIVDVIDNGAGMSREVLEEVYMQLGRSTKGQGEAIGGFGKARILTSFSQRAYSIRSADYTVSGEGAEYRIRSTDPVKGCAVNVTLDAKEARRMHRALTTVLRESSLRAQIFLDLAPATPEGDLLPQPDAALVKPVEGRRFQRFQGWSRKGRAFREMADDEGRWGLLHVAAGETAQRNRAIVRVGGMAMYAEYCAAPVQVTLDLEPARARQILTASRDAMRGEFRSEFQKLLNEIAIDRKSATRDRGAAPRSGIRGARGTAHGEGMPRPQDAPPAPLSVAPEAIPDPEAISTRFRENPNAPLTEAEIEARRQQMLDEDPRLQAIAPRLAVAHHVGDATPGQRQAAARWDGSTWARPGNDGRTAELIHAAWTAACRHALGALAEIRPDAVSQPGDRWVTGFAFDQNMLGCHMEIAPVRHALLLNPVDHEGRTRIKLSDPASVKDMIATAIHEVAHVATRYHDEEFASVLTRLMGSIRDRDIEAAIRDELKEARAWQERRQEVWQELAANPELIERVLGVGAAEASGPDAADEAAPPLAADANPSL